MPASDLVLAPLVRKLGAWVELSQADERAIASLPHRVKSMDRHSFIIRDRQETTHCCVMLSGFAIRHKIVAGGARQIVSIHMAGDVVDLQNVLLGTADHNVETLTVAEVALIPREAIDAVAFAHPNVGRSMWIDTLVDASIFREWIANVGRRDARSRVAHLLCEFALRLEAAGLAQGTEYQLPLTQEEIGDCVALTSVHVNRTFRCLEEDRLIARQHRRSVTIDDWRKLAAAGDFDSAYLHLRKQDCVAA